MLGYIYQCEFALYHLLDRDQPTTQVSIETVDDVVGGGDGDPLTLLQLKLHGEDTSGKIRNLTDRSEDLWKTLRVWSTLIERKIIDPDTTSFILATTAPLSTREGVAHLLSPKSTSPQRKPAQALEHLKTLALMISQDSGLSESSMLKKGASAFLALTPSQRTALVKNLIVQTSTPSILELRKKIERRLRASGSTDETHRQFVETVVGWWYGACIVHLRSRGETPITFDALERRMSEIGRSLALGGLPRYPSAETPTTEEMEALKDRTFVRQITAVGIPEYGALMTSAMLDFYKADAHRKLWLQELRLDYVELSRFENDLRGAWAVNSGVAEVDCVACAAEANPESGYQGIGRRVLQQTLSSKATTLKGFEGEFVARGSYHILANGDRPTIGWHPHWRKRFRLGEPSE